MPKILALLLSTTQRLCMLSASSPNRTMSCVYSKSISEPPGKRKIPENSEDESVEMHMVDNLLDSLETRIRGIWRGVHF